MPTHIKLILSAIVLAVAALVGWWQQGLGETASGYVVWALGLFMIVALWLFPETKRRAQKDNG
ncbi:hypothetical protein [Algihabitans albus]|uniref:hypothetical protein n=1 Tax=Algihabitans albus TaxID=2164067 RepID=UPI000E5CFF16|nr:hypothetical protein [Algihabitans albus]